MTHTEVNRAITRLRTLKRDLAGAQAYALATRLLPAQAQYKTPADLAALWLAALALYYAAVMRTAEEHGVATAHNIIEERRRLLGSDDESQDVFTAHLDYPEGLQNYMRALSQLPKPLVMAAMEIAIKGLALP